MYAQLVRWGKLLEVVPCERVRLQGAVNIRGDGRERRARGVTVAAGRWTIQAAGATRPCNFSISYRRRLAVDHLLSILRGVNFRA